MRPKMSVQQPKGYRTVSRYGEAAKRRAITEARDAKVEKDGSVSVSSLSQPGARHRVTFWAGDHGELIWFTCTCPSGHYRGHLPLPCVHATQAGMLLESYSLARWATGLWYST
jgi:hypothetical protein